MMKKIIYAVTFLMIVPPAYAEQLDLDLFNMVKPEIKASLKELDEIEVRIKNIRASLNRVNNVTEAKSFVPQEQCKCEPCACENCRCQPSAVVATPAKSLPHVSYEQHLIWQGVVTPAFPQIVTQSQPVYIPQMPQASHFFSGGSSCANGRCR